MELLYVIVAICAILGLALFGVPYLKNKKIISDENRNDSLQLTDDLLKLLNIAVKKSIKSESDKEIVDKVINSIRSILEFTANINTLPTPHLKAEFAKAEILSQLLIYDIHVDEDMEILVEILCNRAFQYIKNG